MKNLEKSPLLDTLKNTKFCVFDLETTGGNHQYDQAIEIGLVEIENLEITNQKTFILDPQIPIPEFIQKLTSISPADVEGAPKVAEVVDEILEMMEGRVLVAHNSSFDIPFFNSILTRLNRPPLPNKSLCTNLMTKHLIPGLLNSNLNYMSRIFDIPHTKAHRALDDALATAKLFICYLNIFLAKGISKINHLYYPMNKYELDRAHFKQSQKALLIEKLKTAPGPYLLTLKGKNGVIEFSFPLCPSQGDMSIILKNIEERPWETATLRLFGHFLEAFFNYAQQYSKLDRSLRTESLNKISEMYLKEKRRHDEEHLIVWSAGKSQQSFGPEFLVIPHIVPEQYMIYPISSLHHQSHLLFRYPAHQKKLAQFLNSRGPKSQKLRQSGKRPKHSMWPELEAFVDQYLYENLKDSDFTLVSYEILKDGPKPFSKQLTQIDKKRNRSFKFPKHYL